VEHAFIPISIDNTANMEKTIFSLWVFKNPDLSFITIFIEFYYKFIDTILIGKNKESLVKNLLIRNLLKR